MTHGPYCAENFTFGQDGKPYYFQGPNDSPEFVARVMATLERHCGPGNFHFTLALGKFEEDSENDSSSSN